ncbi:hypothetical protein JZ751_028135 [Albula glossodonta]|uniref:tRNA methyltransferase 10 homolog C n=1 Tax=Albula glossodonta TaxID=121402 RepID=A0A8T2PKY5_9TELE|nr:hypothetical protein JZ751_028135 [Albula glossodonta]
MLKEHNYSESQCLKMRLSKTLLVKLLWRNSSLKTPVPGGKRAPICAFPVCQTRSICTALVLKKEASAPVQPKGGTAEKLDLDVWKSVMMSPSVQEEEKNEEGAVGQSGQGSEHSPLEATRELVEMWRQAGKRVPEQMNEEELQTLRELSTKSSRRKYLKYLAIREGHKKTRKIKQEKKRNDKMVVAEERKNEEEDEEDGLKNTFLLQFWQRSIDTMHNWRAAQAMVFGQPLVFDMSYEQHMSDREIKNTVNQLLECEGWNRRSADPFHLHFCNLQPEGEYHRELVRRYGPAWERLLITATKQRHVDIFPHSQLVYLSPDSPNVLKAFDHSKVYIVGSIVDRANKPGLSLANAKRLKMATARLPLDEFLQWDTGAKNLTLDQIIRILVTIKDTGKWQEALEFVPKRKHEGFYQPQQEGRSGSFFIDKAKPVPNREAVPNSTYKTKTFVKRENREYKSSGDFLTRAGVTTEEMLCEMIPTVAQERYVHQPVDHVSEERGGRHWAVCVGEGVKRGGGSIWPPNYLLQPSSSSRHVGGGAAVAAFSFHHFTLIRQGGVEQGGTCGSVGAGRQDARG